MSKEKQAAKPAETKGVEGRGHGVILYATGPGLYEVAYVETDGRTITKWEAKEGKTDAQGRRGHGIHVALTDLNAIVSARIREASKLWRR